MFFADLGFVTFVDLQVPASVNEIPMLLTE